MNFDSSYSEETYKILAEFPFDSTRKCMSVLLKDEQSEKYYLYTKGADNVMLEKMAFPTDSALKISVVNDLFSYSCQGYRTLVIGMKEITEADFLKFNKIH